MAAYVVGIVGGRKRFPDTGLHGGGTVARDRGWYPAGPVHAASPGDTVSLCGIRLDGVTDDPWPPGSFVARCRDCDGRVAHRA